MNADKFLQGQKDCRDGVPHESGKGEDYDRGYATQYSMEETLTAIFEVREHEKKSESRRRFR